MIPEGLGVSGVILSDQVKSLDWKARKAEFQSKLSPEAHYEVVQKLLTLIR
jgi:mRNA interferase MazF